MKGTTHLLIGFYIGLLFVGSMPLFASILFMASMLLGSLAPDLDHQGSKLGKRLKPLSSLLSLAGHRTILHAIWVPAILYMMYVWHWHSFMLIAFIIGYVSHIVADGFTKKGINFIHPFQHLRLQGFVETGGILEWLLFWGIFLLACVKVIGLTPLW